MVTPSVNSEFLQLLISVIDIQLLPKSVQTGNLNWNWTELTLISIQTTQKLNHPTPESKDIGSINTKFGMLPSKASTRQIQENKYVFFLRSSSKQNSMVFFLSKFITKLDRYKV